MKIFIAGGTGVLGRRLVPQLIQDNHEVSVLARSQENVKQIKAMHAKPVKTSLFQVNDLITKTTKEEVFIHIATSIPKNNKSKPVDWEMNERIRLEGTKNLIQAALNADCKLYIQQSATFGYGHHGEKILDEGHDLEIPVQTAIEISDDYRKILDDVKRMEDLVTNAYAEKRLPSIILRFGWFYSYDSTNIRDIVEGNMAHVFRKDPYISIISVDDAVRAIIAAIDEHEGNLGEIFNVVDDSDTTWREFINYGADFADNRKPMAVPAFLVKLLYNEYALNFLLTSTRVSNDKIKNKIGWELVFPTYREGLPHEIRKYNQFLQ